MSIEIGAKLLRQLYRKRSLHIFQWHQPTSQVEVYIYIYIYIYIHLEPQTTSLKWMFGETTISYIKIWNHPIETTIYKWLFGVPGIYYSM